MILPSRMQSGNDLPACTLIVSNDRPVAEQLRWILEEDHCQRVHIVGSVREAHEAVQKSPPGMVFLDCRVTAGADSLAPLLDQLGRQGKRRIPVIAVSETGYVCDWAVVADLIVSGHLQLPLDRGQLSRLLREELSRGPAQGDCSADTPRVVRGRTIVYKTHTPEMYSMLDDLVTVAAHDVTVLLTGETGTGKTTVARLIHELSPRHNSKLLTVACGAIPRELIESELFGHLKGAFTSADRAKLGKFDVALDGTLLLDEIDVLGPAQQTKLLRVIETGEFEPVGGNETHHSKARVVAASNVDLKTLTQRNEFRADLYYRLNTLELHIPPLRQRPRDIVPLALDFIEEFCSSHDIRIRHVHPDFLHCLKCYRWPGNVRELKNHVRRAVLFCRTGVLTPQMLAPHFRRPSEPADSEPLPEPPRVEPERTPPRTIAERVAGQEREILQQALQENNHNRTATARALGLSRVGLYKKMKRLGMITPRDASADSP
ncbi:MAG: sigma-54-dependent Fis family transcriptional regulator [Pirellulales bacterium]|nr:sigma-54-dependent Fis family transcriptional regulator [Pirellulales bacterium]